MIIQPLNTADDTTSYTKTLLYATHGWGKTTQANYYKRRYGKGFVISGESGLKAIRDEGHDYLPFSSWDGENDHSKKVYSYKGILRWVASEAFRERKYNWIMVDSFTELSDLVFNFAEKNSTLPENLTKDGKVNDFLTWETYSSNMLGAAKWVRDLPMHVIVTSLAKEGEDENGNICHWPMLKGKQIQRQLPGIFDNVICGIRRYEEDVTNPAAPPKSVRYCITDNYKGWQGKVRDEKRRLKTVEREFDLTKLYDRMEMSDEDYAKYLSEATGSASV